ncbi:hypothetical protein [Acinetobacter sp. YH12145]|uniref:hypothetical protein n=1 Tax=Acinetobacter sp. YH12145 TaxID=2601129 RepID=UPI0015D406D3|nr:hypothetical protein [Acinetobacter sp. YH12145]
MFRNIILNTNKTEIDFEILKSEQIYSKFEACLNAHGMYETLKFSLSLSPVVHNLMDELIDENNNIMDNPTYEHFQAYSTYLHETIHWWQHVGSVSGLLFSLSYLGITYINFEDLKEIYRDFGAKKSLKSWSSSILKKEGALAQKKLAKANTVVNNTLDIEYYQLLALEPKRFAHYVNGDNFFESIGHSYHMAYSQLNRLLDTVIDDEFKILPHPENWQKKFNELSDKKIDGYYYGSVIIIPPIGMLDIYEGQAKFIQLQFLISLYPELDSMEYWCNNGHLYGVYLSAFNEYKRILNIDVIEKISDPLVGLFLLICDLAINPSVGFPFNIEKYENFITDVDVGIRFCKLTVALREKIYLIDRLNDYSKQEYLYLSYELCEHAGYTHPSLLLDKILSWENKSDKFVSLMKEYESFEFDLSNQPIRVMFSHFIEFCKDKSLRPEFFCWPSKFLISQGSNQEFKELWLKHLSLFGDHPYKKGVYPRLRNDRKQENVQKTFNDFYGGTALYDLTRQWILIDGDFKLNYNWLSENYIEKDIFEWANETFKSVYSIDLREFENFNHNNI